MKKFIAKFLLILLTLSTIHANTKVVISKDNLGDFLIAPLYIAKGTICSKITVYNTNPNKSILAKVVIREQIASHEVDLPIFLSPGDVWNGKICETNGSIFLYSNDDSNHPLIRKILIKGKNLTQHSIEAGYPNVDFSAGYIEIYPIAEFKEKNNKKIKKSLLVKRWDKLIEGVIPLNSLINGVDGYSLSGNIEFETDGKITTILPMKAFKGVNEILLTGKKIDYGKETSVKLLFGKRKQYQILKLLQHNQVNFTYSNYGKNQYIIFTFPFSHSENQIRKFEVIIRDTKENKLEKEKVIFSPAPKPKFSYIQNEVAIISIEDLIKQTHKPHLFKQGQITIKNLKNVTNVQLGKTTPSLFATFITFDKNNKNHIKVLNGYYIPAK